MSWFRLKHHFSGAPAWPFRPPVVPQDKLYPLHTGGVEAVGEGRGRGYNLNVPLPPGSGWGAYDAAMQRVVAPALRAFKPDLIVVSSGSGENVWRGRYFGSSRFFSSSRTALSTGFDAAFLDTLGECRWSSAERRCRDPRPPSLAHRPHDAHVRLLRPHDAAATGPRRRALRRTVSGPSPGPAPPHMHCRPSALSAASSSRTRAATRRSTSPSAESRSSRPSPASRAVRRRRPGEGSRADHTHPSRRPPRRGRRPVPQRRRVRAVAGSPAAPGRGCRGRRGEPPHRAAAAAVAGPAADALIACYAFGIALLVELDKHHPAPFRSPTHWQACRASSWTRIHRRRRVATCTASASASASDG